MTDQQLLREHQDRRSETAFAEIVRRHIDLVYSAALRMVHDAPLAEDVTQGVFLALAQNAGQLAEHPVLTGWLHRTAQNLAANAVRSEVRRRAREHEAVAMNQLLNDGSDGPWAQIAPHLDEALGELSEPDRDAVLLRYFERKSASEMAEALGISDEAAQKRVGRAVERLRDIFVRRGLTVGAGGLALILSAKSVHAAPVGLAAAVSGATWAGTTLAAATTTTATKAIAMTTLQKALLGTTLIAAVGTGIYEACQNYQLLEDQQALQRQQAPLVAEVAQARQELNAALRQLAGLRLENERLQSNAVELAKLRGEVSRWRADAEELAQRKAVARNAAGNTNDPLNSAAQSWIDKASFLQRQFAQTPQRRIPELQYLSESDWLRIAEANLDTEADIRKAMAHLRDEAKEHFAPMMAQALSSYLSANNGQLPADVPALKTYFAQPVDDALLQRYSMLKTGSGSDLGWQEMLIAEKAPADNDYDYLLQLGLKSWRSEGVGKNTGNTSMGGFSSSWSWNPNAAPK